MAVSTSVLAHVLSLDLSLADGGSFYLPYRHHYSQEQLLAAYPSFPYCYLSKIILFGSLRSFTTMVAFLLGLRHHFVRVGSFSSYSLCAT
jgi:hypothetical protein